MNRRYFEGQLYRFCRPEYGIKDAARINAIQTQDYR